MIADELGIRPSGLAIRRTINSYCFLDLIGFRIHFHLEMYMYFKEYFFIEKGWRHRHQR